MRSLNTHSIISNKLILLLLLISFISNAQVMQLEVLGGAVVTQGSTVTINAGNSLDFRITNIETNNCKRLRIKDVDISNTTDFDINPNNPKRNIKPYGCSGGKKFLDFEIETTSTTCVTASTLVTVEIKNQADFTFTLEINSSPEIYVLGGSPFADIIHGDTTTSDTNGTFFGVVDEGATVTRTYAIANIGNCPLDITSLATSNSDFAVSSPYPIPWYNLAPYYYIVIDVTFTAPVAGTGTQSSVISINNTDNTTFTFTVSAEMFNYNIPGPGGITADFRLWLKTTRGVTKSSTKVSNWADVGTNGKDATQPVSSNQPTYLDDATSNINFNPVIEFENDGASVEQYIYNSSNGFYSQDIFIVIIPDATMTSSSAKNTIFAGISTGNANDITGVGFGDYSTEFTNEVLSYNQDVASSGNFNGEAELNSTYSNAGLINIRNNAASSPTGQDILYNSALLTTSSVSNSFANVGSPGPPTVLGTEYWVGKNFNQQGNLNGRVAEIFTFAERVSDTDRQKIESYLGIKYGITLGTSTQAQKDYINSFDTSVWDISSNTGYNYHVAGIGRDSISDLNQKQSKTLNVANEVTIGLGGVYTTNSVNTNEFKKDGDFLVWGCDNGAFSGSNTNTVTIATGLTTSLTRIDRKWKIVESIEDVKGDVENVFVSIPSAAFSSFTLSTDEEYALIVADNANFANGDIIDVIPLKSDGGSNLQTWYDFDGTKFFTFGKVSKLSENHAISFASGDFLVGEYDLNLSVDSFTISAWIKSATNTSTRTIMAKSTKLQLRLNSADKIEVMIDDDVTPKFISDIVMNDGKWHQITFVYDSGTILLYVDGVLDKSVQNVVHPSPNYNNFSIGSVYIDKDNIINPFLGEIDEVYVWDLALTENQIQYLVNQEIERFDNSGTDYVDGKTLPQAASSNPVSAIPWSSLRVYYDFNSFYGSTIEGLTDDRFFLRLKYLNKNKTLVDTQTIPTPYISAADGSWDTAATWNNNTVLNTPNALSLDGVTYIDWNIVEIAHNITSGNKNISLLGLVSTAGKLTIDGTRDINTGTGTGHSLTISHYIELDGVIDLEGESQLIQAEGSILDTDSGGYIEKDQQGTANSFNYNYWSSSVGPISGNTATKGTGITSTNANYNISGVLKDGTDPNNPNANGSIQFLPSHSAADSSTPPNPRIISSYWLYKFYGVGDDYYAWASINESSSIVSGEGYTMKGTSGDAVITSFQNYVYNGQPNNGDITLELDNSSGEVSRLIGNPYPSALDATEFILDNMSIADGGTNATGNIFNGALYFWDHFGEENSHYLSDYVGGYATRNLLTGAVAISNEIQINNDGSSGTKVPGQYIPVNQGFFVTTVLDGFNNDNGTPITSVSGGDIIFKNSQRAFQEEVVAGNSVFMRSTTEENQNNITSNIPIIRLMYDSPTGFHRQIVIGKHQNTSNHFDFGYDAPIADINTEDMFWIFDESKFVIQGVNNFDAGQEFPLGLIVSETGVVQIKIDELENIDNSIELYIKDNLTGEYYDLMASGFEIQLPSGEYYTRFSLAFSNQSLSTDDELLVSNKIVVFMNNSASEIHIKNTGNATINKIVLYNILGQQVDLWNTKLESSTIHLPVNLSTGVYVVKIETDIATFSKKVIAE